MLLTNWLALFAARLRWVRRKTRRRPLPVSHRPRFDVVERLEERIMMAAPVASDDLFTINDTQTATGNLITGNNGNGPDTDADSDPLSITEINGAAITGGQVITLDSGATLTIQTNGTFIYNPNGVFDELDVGDPAETDSFTYTVDDGQGGFDIATVTITINGANSDPLATENIYSVGEEDTVDGNVLTDGTPDSDPEGDPLTLTEINGNTFTDGDTITLPSGAKVTIHSDGEYTYDPNGVFNDLAEGEIYEDGFVYTVSDGRGGTSYAIVTIRIEGENDAPTAVNDEFFVNANGTRVGNLVVGGAGADSDPDENDVLTVTRINNSSVSNGQVITLPSGAKLTIGSNGNYLYNPNGVFNHLTHGQSATDTFTYTITDSEGATSTATATVTIYGPNQTPTATDDANAGAEDADISGNVLTDGTADSDPDGDGLTVVGVDGKLLEVGQPIELESGATLTIAADGTYTYNTNGAFAHLDVGQQDTDTFTYTIFDGNGGSSTATVTITINGVNSDPVAADDDIEVEYEGEHDGNLLTDNNGHGADSDPEENDIEIISISAEGTPYNPGDLITLASGVVITVHADGTYTVDASGANYVLVHGQTAEETFTYTIADGNGGFDTATVTLTIHGPNDAPTASDQIITVGEDLGLVSNLILADQGDGVDEDLDGDDLTVIAINDSAFTDGGFVILPSGAAVQIFGNGNYLYLTNGAFESLAVGETATDSFTYTISDGHGGYATATVHVTITGANDAPNATNNTNTVSENGTTSGNVITDNNGNGVDSDPDSTDGFTVTHINGIQIVDGQTYTLAGGSQVTIYANGNYTFAANGAFDYLGAGEQATLLFSYTITDDHGAQATATVTITITGVNDAPTANNDTLTVDESDAGNGNLISGPGADVDPDDTSLTVTHINGNSITSGETITLASGAKLTIHADGTYSYDPNGAFDHLTEGSQATDTFTYTIKDPDGLTSTATVTITINGYDDRADIKAVKKGAFVNLSAKGVTLGTDIDIRFTGTGVEIIGLHGTTINGQKSITFEGVTSLRGALGSGDDQVFVSGTAKEFKLDLKQGDNDITFTDFTSLKQTTVISKLGGLDFDAIDSIFQKLAIQTGQFDDSISFLGSDVLSTTSLKLLGGLNAISIDGSTFIGNTTFHSTGDDTRIDIEFDIGNTTPTKFQGNVKMTVGNNATINLSDTLVSDVTSFEKSLSITGKKGSPGTLTVSQVLVTKQPKIRNMEIIA